MILDLLILILICFLIMVICYHALALICGLIDELDKEKKEKESEETKKEEIDK